MFGLEAQKKCPFSVRRILFEKKGYFLDVCMGFAAS
jgi:hypothetical protein